MLQVVLFRSHFQVVLQVALFRLHFSGCTFHVVLQVMLQVVSLRSYFDVVSFRSCFRSCFRSHFEVMLLIEVVLLRPEKNFNCQIRHEGRGRQPRNL